MSDLFKLVKIPPPKKHFVTIEGSKIEVSLKKKLEIMKHGEDAYILNPDIVLRPKPTAKTKYIVLKKAEKGYLFQDGDIHWPNALVEGGETWLIEYE